MSEKVVDRLCNAMYLLLKKKKFEDISIKELILDAKVNRSSYSYHFSDKEEIVDILFDRFKDEFEYYIDENYPKDHEYTRRHIMFSILEYLSGKEQFIRVMHNAGFDEKTSQAIRQVLTDYLNNLETICLDSDGNVYEVPDGKVKSLRTKLHVHYVMGYINFWIEHDYSISAEEMANLLDAVQVAQEDAIRYSNLFSAKGQVG